MPIITIQLCYPHILLRNFLFLALNARNFFCLFSFFLHLKTYAVQIQKIIPLLGETYSSTAFYTNHFKNKLNFLVYGI